MTDTKMHDASGPSHRMLLGDVGGTYARFALLDDRVMAPVATLRVCEYPGIEQALQDLLSRGHPDARPRTLALACAGPVEDGRCQMTNSRWLIDAAGLSRRFSIDTVRLVNDMVATAWSLPRLRAADLCPLGGPELSGGAPALVLAPGTGFGVACLTARGKRPSALPSEAGHAGIAAAGKREHRIIAVLEDRFGRVSVERMLSGPGLENIHGAIMALDGRSLPRRTAAEIVAAATEGCEVSREALELFCGLLGSVAGDLALTFSARGGVYIAGGIVPRLIAQLRASAFRRRFEAKGRLSRYVEAIPSVAIVRPNAALIGLAAMLDAKAGERHG